MFGDTIKKLRDKNNMTQRRLAQILNVSTSAVGKWEGRGNVIPSAEILVALANCFDVSVDYLLMGGEVQQNRIDRQKEFSSLFNMLSDFEQRIIIAQIKGILADKETIYEK